MQPFCKTRSIVKERVMNYEGGGDNEDGGVASGIPSTVVATSFDIATSSEVAIGV